MKMLPLTRLAFCGSVCSAASSGRSIDLTVVKGPLLTKIAVISAGLLDNIFIECVGARWNSERGKRVGAKRWVVDLIK